MARSSAVASDAFNRSTGMGSDWLQLNTFWGSVTIVLDTKIRGTSAQPIGNSQAARWAGSGSFTDDQWASLELVNLDWQTTDYAIGVICRASSDQDNLRDYYGARVCSDSAGPNYTTQLFKIVNGTATTLHSASVAWTAGDLIELEVEGSELRVCKNGTPLGGSFTQTDTSLTTGLPGVCGSGDANTVATGDNWTAGNITGGGSAAGAISHYRAQH